MIFYLLITYSFYLILLLAGRDYETRNYSFEEVNYHMAENLAKVCYFTFAVSLSSYITTLTFEVIMSLLFSLSLSWVTTFFFLHSCLFTDVDL